MAESEVSICSSALGLLGDDGIVDLAEDSDRARLCNRLYPNARDAVLRSYPWRFALRRAALSQDAGYVSTFEFTNAFVLPTSPYCLRVWRTNLDELDYVSWQVEGRHLLTNESSVSIQYIARITDVSSYDAMFIEALIRKLAMMFAFPVTSDRGIEQDMASMYAQALDTAMKFDGQEGTPRVIENTVLLDVR